MEGLLETTPEEIDKRLSEARTILKREIFDARELLEKDKTRSGNPYLTCLRTRLYIIKDLSIFINSYDKDNESVTRVTTKSSELLNELEETEEGSPEISDAHLNHFLSEIESLGKNIL